MSNYFHTDSASTTAWLAGVLHRAQTEGLSIRLSVDANNSLKVKLGEGMWSPPIESTPDMYREGVPVGNFILTVEDGPSISDIQNAACKDDWCHVCRRATDHWGEHDDEQLRDWANTPLGRELLKR